MQLIVQSFFALTVFCTVSGFMLKPFRLLSWQAAQRTQRTLVLVQCNTNANGFYGECSSTGVDELAGVTDGIAVTDIGVDSDSSDNSTTVPGVVTVDPFIQAVALKEEKLMQELQSLESELRAERATLTRLKDKMSESGKNGYFIVQAQVNDYAVSNKGRTGLY